ncbi:MAG: ribonuclease P protein component [Dysgonamonadaceae bacterium]|nr:ribonuclease P protein component [Dysgonamonadaceae bacterium]
MQTFTKSERIFIQREIDLLFTEGKAFSAYPLRVVYAVQKPFSGAPAAILISIPKKRFKRAVKRNRGKRLIRETYRLNKTLLWESLAASGKQLLIAFIYIGNELCDFPTMDKAMRKAMTKLTAILKNPAASD